MIDTKIEAEMLKFNLKSVTTCTSEHKGTIAEGRYTQISEGYYEHE